ncbi:universal stress protein [Natronobacterium texcoconense]|uniref:Nucleotide-binding universal stress protein, UspA family n=1 Tax=Natronobacterium texcoconense TaxID=1095778 RepID=A0A1H1GPZ5_NATTX|nr:universal stress protein [Natronobacterium texcoconense]SDR15211.1 Nucleotide-binding universal stress protein, UspA family [Natronobacterium texcoconense]
MTFDTLLIPTDGSDPAENAARRGFDLADRLGASVHVLSVADSSVATGVGYSGDSASIRERLRETAQTRATALRDEAVERGLEATAAVREGIPANEITEYADDHGIDAIVIGTAGRSGVARAIVGSVADKVVRTAPVPVVTTTPDAANDETTDSVIDSILVPTDGSEKADAGSRPGLELAAQLEATAHVLSAIDAELEDAIETVVGDDVDLSNELEARANDHLEDLAADARDRDLEVVATITEGTPAETIVEYAESEGIDLIAMGTAGRGGFERALVGSVTDEVVRTATVPVLTNRPDVEQ